MNEERRRRGSDESRIGQAISRSTEIREKGNRGGVARDAEYIRGCGKRQRLVLPRASAEGWLVSESVIARARAPPCIVQKNARRSGLV